MQGKVETVEENEKEEIVMLIDVETESVDDLMEARMSSMQIEGNGDDETDMTKALMASVTGKKRANVNISTISRQVKRKSIAS